MSLIDEEFHWFFCGNEGEARVFGPYRNRNMCEDHANNDGCEHDHIVMTTTGRRLIQTLPPTAWHSGGVFFAPDRDGNEVAVILGLYTDVPADEKIALYDEMADVLEQRNSPKSAVMASTSPSDLW